MTPAVRAAVKTGGSGKLEQHPDHRDAAERQNDLNGEGFGVMDIVADPPDFGVQPGKEGEEQGSSERQAASPPESDLLQIVERHGRYQCHHEDQHIHPTEPPIPAQVEHAVQEGNHCHNSQQCHKTRREIPLFQHPRQHHRHAEHGQEEGLGIVVGHICGRETLAVSRQKHGLDHPQIFLPAEPRSGIPSNAPVVLGFVMTMRVDGKNRKAAIPRPITASSRQRGAFGCCCGNRGSDTGTQNTGRQTPLHR